MTLFGMEREGNMSNFNLICWSGCGKTQGVNGPHPTLGLDISEATQAVSWKSIFDMDRGRVLVFCSDECVQKAMKKDGSIRLRMPKKKE
jgi:hypothetical protein